MTNCLGIDIGSTNVKVCLLDAEGGERHGILPHEGALQPTLDRLMAELELNGSFATTRVLATGTEGRHRLGVPELIAPVCIERALSALELRPRAVVSMGGEDLVVYGVDARGRVVSNFAGNKCASGTGEFFRQQLGRMNLELEGLEAAANGARVHRISARCSVFMKSDCTHRLNKGEATKGDIALSLSKLMADKVSEFLTKAKILNGVVVLAGGVTKNRFLLQFLKEAWKEIEFVVPEQAPYLEAFGAAHLAKERGATVSAPIVVGGQSITYNRFPSLNDTADKVRYVPSMRGRFDPKADYLLGVDGGSTTTKVALINCATLEIVAAHYGRTHGDPVTALKGCLRSVKEQLGGAKPRIRLVATTGSSRELLGVFLETSGVYNEIIAHTVGTTYFEAGVDTIFEIGGQDAKYVSINNGVPIDYTMNEACSAGTGSFLEESARGDLNVQQAEEIGPLALAAKAPLKFGEHCSAFINSDIRKAIQQGATREEIVAGLIFSIVANYLNRVVGNRTVGERIVLQGGVAKNPAVPLAFAQMTGKRITVPPDPELMGCFGVARLAQQKHTEGLLDAGDFDLDAMIEREIAYRNTFTCKACDNYCTIRNLEVGTSRYPFGGRCSKHTNARKKRRINEEQAVDYTAVRHRMLFEEYAPDPSRFVARSAKSVGVPMALSVHSLWPFYSTFFHTLGVRVVPSRAIAPLGVAKQESNYCYPVEIAHGAVQDVLDQGVDFLFLPHFRDMPSMEKGEVHACVCPLTQGLPYFSRHAFGLEERRILRPVVSFKHSWDASRTAFEDVAEQLGFSRAEGAAAYADAIRQQQRFIDAYRLAGRKLLDEIRSHPDTIYVALLGRPYNAFTRDANMGIPRKVTSQGVSVVPFDMIYDPAEEIFPNMYWYYGQQDMKAVRRIKEIPNLYLTWISNFSCAPDSFMLHYLRWMMGHKPYLVLEIDSHTADAGLDTRVEAFLDIVESYRRHTLPKPIEPAQPRYSVALKEEYCDVIDNETGERIDARDPRVTLVWPSMGDLAVQLMTEASRKQGVKAVHLPIPDGRSTQLARNVASGKECIPALLVLGSILQFFEKHPPNREGEIFLVFVPSTLGPCRTGQYYVFYERLIEEMGWENVKILVGGSQNSYREFGPTFSREVWRAIVISDYMTDARLGIQLLAEDVPAGLEVFERVWQDIVTSFKAGSRELDEALVRAGRALSRIPRRRTLDDVKKVLIVGEIYVRRDDFSVREINEFLVSKGIFPKVTGITEWFYYTDWARKYLMVQRRKRDGFLKVMSEGGLREEAWFHVEATWKSWVDHKVAARLMPTGLIPEAPHDLGAAIEAGRDLFVDPEMESEATVSPAVAAAAMRDGYAGVAIIAPFGCLPGRLIEGVYSPWAKARGYPVIALENDGQPYPPNIVSRMEVFAHNTLRFTPVKKERGLPVATGSWGSSWMLPQRRRKNHRGDDEPAGEA